MKTRLLLLTAVALASTFAWAYDPRPTPDQFRAERLQRDLTLVEAMVDGSLALAAEDEPLKRAAACGTLVRSLAQEIHRASQGQDAPRALELGKHLQALLDRGLAPNLSSARRSIHPGSDDEQQLLALRDETSLLLGQLEDELQRALPPDTPSDMQKALGATREGRSQVERAMTGTGKPRSKPNGAKP